MKALPRVDLGFWPTPVHELPRLTKALGLQLSVKRDDLSGLAFGGNKTRKLELLCAAAVAAGADMLLTAGAIQSNHCRQTAAAAAKLGLKCKLVLVGEEPAQRSANLLLNGLLGAKIAWTSKERREQSLQAEAEAASAAGSKPYVIPYGGSNAFGAAAYANALEELLTQGVRPDWIVFATSSGGTQAGLVAGAEILGYNGRILGISVDERKTDLAQRIVALAEETSTLLGQRVEIHVDRVLINDDYLGAGYAVMGDAEREAIHLFTQHEGLFVDPVYTSRAAAGMIDLIRKGFFKKSDKVLFWHTGGTPALFTDTYRSELAH